MNWTILLFVPLISSKGELLENGSEGIMIQAFALVKQSPVAFEVRSGWEGPASGSDFEVRKHGPVLHQVAVQFEASGKIMGDVAA